MMKKIMRLAVVGVLCLLITIMLNACNRSVSTVPDQSGNTDPKSGQNSEPAGNQPGNNIGQNELKQWDGVKGKILTANYPAEITKYLEDNRQKETQQAFNINNKTYIVLTMGQQPSSGYQIELNNLVLKNGELNVQVNYEKPGKSDNVATVITYPSLVIETDDIYEGHYLISYKIEK